MKRLKNYWCKPAVVNDRLFTLSFDRLYSRMPAAIAVYSASLNCFGSSGVPVAKDVLRFRMLNSTGLFFEFHI